MTSESHAQPSSVEKPAGYDDSVLVEDKEATDALRRIGLQHCEATRRCTTEKQRREAAAQAAREIMLKDCGRCIMPDGEVLHAGGASTWLADPVVQTTTAAFDVVRVTACMHPYDDSVAKPDSHPEHVPTPTFSFGIGWSVID